jgi:queuine tRNA-ribosyltransferase
MSNVKFSFSVKNRSSAGEARAGVFQTAHSIVETPVFMPVATHAALRGQKISELDDIGYQIILSNTYHLLLRPGVEVFQKFGGIHPFMGWPRSVLTDSGGFQLFSLSKHLQMSEEGALFRSYVDGKKVLLTPEVSIQTQRAINSDIMMVLDQCIPALSERAAMEQAMHLTHRWAKRSLIARGDSTQALFGIVQGGCFLDLRRESAARITELPFDGYAIGGVAVGEERSIREDVVEHTAKLLPSDRPRYLMGVGTPIDLLEAVWRGIDMFDCILPTALAAQGSAFTYEGKTNLGRGIYAGSNRPIDPNCRCSTCQRYSRGYLHHLHKSGEYLAHTLIGIHNLTFYFDLMTEIRRQIIADTLESFYREKRETLGANEVEFAVTKPLPKTKKSTSEVGAYEIARRGEIVSVLHRPSGEIMHSVSAPLLEAEQLYIKQSGLRERVAQNPEKPLVIWDVGLGAATNAMAAIQAYEGVAATNSQLARLSIVSFENDLDSLRLVAKNPFHFEQMRHAAPHAILKNRAWKNNSGKIDWILLEGDCRDTLKSAPLPECIFFDPFSYKTNPSLWTLTFFKMLYALCREENTSLFTYSASTGIRAALLVAGFHVALGCGVGPKESTTVALTEKAAGDGRYQLLSGEWLARWERSDNQFPPLLAESEKAGFMNTLREHQLFR